MTMIGAGATLEETEAVRSVMEREGLRGSCEAVLGAQGEGISVIVIQTAVSTFLAPFLTPLAQNAHDRLKEFFRDMHDARNDKQAHLRQTYVRPDVMTSEDWERAKPHGRMPGWRREGANEPELVLTDLMPDEAWAALLVLDFDNLPGGSYSWSDQKRAWQRSGHN